MDRMIDTVKAFDDYAGNYDQWFDSPEGKALFSAEAEAVRLLTKGLEHPFLEIGVGTGRFAEKLGINIGIDPSDRALDIARRRGIRVQQATGEILPFKDGLFGAVFLLFTLCFVKDAGAVIAEAKRVLKSGGGLIIGFINRESPWGEHYMKKKTEGHPIYRHARFYTIDEVAGLLRQVGMGVGAYASTLCRQPSQELTGEKAYDKLIGDAGFVCILSRKE